MNVPQRCAAETDGGGDVQKRALHKHHVRRVDCNVGACADGNAGIGGGEGGGVVDAVADHSDGAVFLKLMHDGLLAARQNARDYIVHARKLADGVGCALVIARQHHDADAHAAQLPDGLRAFRLDGVRHGDEAEELSVFRKQQRRFAGLGKRIRLLLNFLRQCKLRSHIFDAAAKQLRVQYRRGQTAAGDGGELLRRFGLQFFFFAALHDRCGQRMLALCLQRDGCLQKLPLRHAVRRDEICDLRLAGGDGSGLVQGDDARPTRMLQTCRRFEQNAVFRAYAAADHDGDRRGKTQRARAADDQHGNAPRKRKGEFPAQQQPDDCCDKRDGNDRRDEHTRDLVRRLGNRRFRRRRVGNHADDLAERGILADAGCLTPEEARAVDRCGGNTVAGSLVNRDAFAGQRRFVDGARAVQHNAVNRDALARTDDEHVALANLRGGNFDLFAVADDRRRLRCEGHEALERVRGFALGVRLKQLADGDEREDHGGGLKIKFVHIRHGGFAAAVELRVRHGKQRVDAPPIGRRCAERDERVHVRRAAQQALCAAHEKFLIDDHDDPGQQQLDKAHGDVVAAKPAWQRPAPHHVAHREIHQNEQKCDRGDQPLFKMRRLPVLQRACVRRRSGLLPAHRRAVARVLDGFDDGGRLRRTLDAHRVCEQTHGAGCNARHLFDRLFHTGAASGAVHAGHGILLHENPSLGANYFISFCRVAASSSTISSWPFFKSRVTHVRRCSARSSRLKALMAALTAADCVSTSLQ